LHPCSVDILHFVLHVVECCDLSQNVNFILKRKPNNNTETGSHPSVPVRPYVVQPVAIDRSVIDTERRVCSMSEQLRNTAAAAGVSLLRKVLDNTPMALRR
jgi:hypothetical protein